MSLYNDFGMYYCGTVVLTPEGRPFIIRNVDRRSGGREVLSDLRFQGDEIMNASGDRNTRTIAHDDMNFDLPPLGWRLINGAPRWVTYRPYKTVKKGLHPVRLSNFTDRDFNRTNIWSLFQDFEGRISDDWCIVGTELWFKGFLAGNVESNGNLVLLHESQYLRPRLAAQVTGRTITVLPQ